MATEVDKNRIRGIGIPDPRITNDTIWPAESSYTQAGAESGLAEAASGNTGSLALVSSGEQTSGTTLDVQINRSGYPAVGGAGAQMVWKNRADAGTLYRGLEQPATITEQSLLLYDAGSTERAARDICTLPDGTQLALFETSLGGSTYRGQVIRKPAGSDTWDTGGITAVITGGAGNGYRYPCLIPVSNDLVLCVAWKYDSAGVYVQLVVYKSTDQGSTWTLHSDGALESGALLLLSAYNSVGEIRGAYGNGEILLLAEFNATSPSTIINNRVMQLSSTDLGRSFDIVATSTGGGDNAGGIRPRVVHVGGVFLVSWICATHSGGTVTGEDVRAVRIPSSTVNINFNTSSGIEVLRDVGNFDNVTENFVASTGGGYASQSMCVADDGAVYLTARVDQDDEAAALGHWCIVVSYDAGQTWQAIGKGAASVATGGDYNGAAWWRSDVLTTSPERVHITYHQGRIVALCNWITSAGVIDDSLSLLYLGGQSTLTLPSYAPYPSDTKRIAYESTYCPADLPAVHLDYTVGVGTGSADVAEDASLNKLRLRIQTSTTGSTAYYVTATPPGTVAEGITAEAHLTYLTGDSTPNNQVGIRLRLADGVNDYTVRIDMGTSGYRVYDVNAAAYAAALVSVDMTAGVALRVSLNAGSVAVYHRPLATNHGHDRAWVTGSTATGLTNNTGSPAASNDFRWGHLAGATTTSKTSYWYLASYTSDEYNGAGLADGFTNPDELTGIPVTGPGGRAYLGRYVYAHGVSGYAHSGDDYTISAEYRYGIRNIDPRIEPSPQRTWRTTADSNLTEIAWRIDEGLGALAAPGNELLFIYLQGVNFDEWVLKTHNGSTWSNLTPVTRNSAGLQSLPFTRAASTIIPAGSATGSRYIAFNELVGGTVDLGGGKLRKIVRNTEGIWKGASVGATKRPTIWLAGVDGTEATSGNCDIWAPRMYCAVMRTSPGTIYRGYKLTISNQATADGYYEIGALAIGWVQPFGYDNSADRELSTELRTQITEAGSGIRFSRVDGLPRRAVALRWSTLIPTADWQGLTPDPAYRLATDTAGADPVALRHDALEMLEGVLRETEGAHVPIVYLPRITKGPPDTECSSSPARSLYGRIVGTSYTREVAQGNEAEDEAQRSTAGLVIEEEL